MRTVSPTNSKFSNKVCIITMKEFYYIYTLKQVNFNKMFVSELQLGELNRQVNLKIMNLFINFRINIIIFC